MTTTDIPMTTTPIRTTPPCIEMRSPIRAIAIAATCFSVCSCTSDAPERNAPPRGTLGRELYSIVCDRIGAQALREDVAGASYHDVCHGNGVRVDSSRLVPLDPEAVDIHGNRVSLEQQKTNRARRIARIEAVARRRDDLIAAIDATIPDTTIPAISDGTAQATPLAASSTTPPHTIAAPPTLPLRRELAATLSRITSLYNDRTIPELTETVAHLLDAIDASPATQNALSQFTTRIGYRPESIHLGFIRQAVAYPRANQLADALLNVVAHDSRPQFDNFVTAAHTYLRTFNVPDSPDSSPLGKFAPRTSSELARAILLFTHDDFVTPNAQAKPSSIVQRDRRGVAAVHLVNGIVPPPFVDVKGDNTSGPDGLADIDAFGRFVTTTGTAPPTPFFAPYRDDYGDISGSGGAIGAVETRDQEQRSPMYDYVSTHNSFLNALLRDILPLIRPEDTDDTITNIVAAAPVIFPTGTANALDSPLIDLTYAFGNVASDPTFDDTLSLVRQIATDHPDMVARLVGMALRIKQIADNHPEAHLTKTSLFWDDFLGVFAKIAQTPNLLEPFIMALGSDDVQGLPLSIGSYLSFKDDLTYDRNDLNGPAFNATTSTVGPMVTPVDRSASDSGQNRSAMQKLLQLLHDADGLATCSKEGAVAHIDIKWHGIPVKLDYPTSPLAKTVCAFLGAAPLPKTMPVCGILRIENVMNLLLDVVLNRAKFDIRDDCLNKILAHPNLTSIVGGPDAFLEDISGIQGFSLHPTINGVNRLLYFDTPHDGLPGDQNNPKTLRFLNDVIDPIPSIVCPLTPFLDNDGTLMNLRTCSSFDDTLRGRDSDSLFPLEQMGFIQSIRPLAAAFADANATPRFVDLIETFYKHWGTSTEAKSGIVTYEPILIEALKTDLFPSIHALIPVLQSIQIPHCSERTSVDPLTHACLSTTPYDGVHVLAEAIRALVDPARSPTLKDRRGQPQTPIDLVIDSIKGFDAAYDRYSATHPADIDRHMRWRSARSSLVDTWFAVDGDGTNARMHNRAFITALPTIIDTLRSQIVAHCPNARINGDCPWGRNEVVPNIARSLEKPIVGASITLLDAIRKNDPARRELEQFARYMLSDNTIESRQATLASLSDMLQVFDDDATITPLLRTLAEATPSIDKGVNFMTRFDAYDPNRTLTVILDRLTAPMMGASGDTRSPLEVFASVIADVNRVDPRDAIAGDAPIGGRDVGNIAAEISGFLMDKESGLEQVYEVIREATVR